MGVTVSSDAMSPAAPHPFAPVLDDAARGVFPPTDGKVDVLPGLRGDIVAVTEFTAHTVLCAPIDPDEAAARGLHGYGGCTHPDLLLWLAGPHRSIGSLDVLLVRPGTGDALADGDGHAPDHSRVERAHRYRRDVRTFGDEAGVVLLGRGVADRLELAVELFDHTPHGEGHGRRLVDLGLRAAPRTEFVWAQVAPGNAASLRVFLAAGFTPVGAEVLLNPN
ncbi:MAG: hypothetical protein RL238_3745 [Actinomycetota bacterium]|jgi:hypothetical protein